jgi:hypothetical protein
VHDAEPAWNEHKRRTAMSECSHEKLIGVGMKSYKRCLDCNRKVFNKETRPSIKALQAQLEAAREVIEFYADHRNWFEDRNKERTSIDNCDIDFQKIKGEYIEMEGIFGGKRARAYLEKWGKG